MNKILYFIVLFQCGLYAQNAGKACEKIKKINDDFLNQSIGIELKEKKLDYSTQNFVEMLSRKKEEYYEVENLVRESFWNVYRPGCLEHYVLSQLRNDADFVPKLDFVMLLDGRIF